MGAWEKRQPKRERDDNTSAERQATFKAKKNPVTPDNATKNQVTPDNASGNQKTPRVEERRVEKIREEKNKDSVANATDGKPSKITDPGEIIFGYGLPMLTNAGTDEKQARSFLGGLRKHHGDDVLIDKLRECAKTKPLQPLEWLAAALPPDRGKPKPNRQEELEASNALVAARFLERKTYVAE